MQQKTKALVSFAVTAKLICVFVYAYAQDWFSHDVAHLSNPLLAFVAAQAIFFFYLTWSEKKEKKHRRNNIFFLL